MNILSLVNILLVIFSFDTHKLQVCYCSYLMHSFVFLAFNADQVGQTCSLLAAVMIMTVWLLTSTF